MAKQTINAGVAPTGAGGDTFRSGSAKLQANDDELYAQLGATAQGVLPAALPVNKGGTGATTAAEARTNLGLGSAATLNAGTGSGNLTVVGAFGGFGSAGISAIGAAYNLGALISNNPSQSYRFNYNTTNRTAFLSQGRTYPSDGVVGGDCVAFVISGAAVGLGAGAVKYSSTGEKVDEIYFLHSKNTTTDANGFIKSASPIVQLFADKIELNDEADEQPIAFEKLGIGDYLIKGSSGFAESGWYIETPKDANGNVLFSVIYTTLENGDISVKTYKKKFDFETVSIVADLDNPVDITENRWIDLRLQEFPQPEIEEPESIAPPEFQPTGLAEAVATVMESHHDSEQ